MLACSAGVATSPEPPPPSLSSRSAPRAGVRALLLLLADRQVVDRYTFEQAVEGDAETRRTLALTLARLPGAEAVDLLESLLADVHPAVRRAAAFALARRRGREVRLLLFGALADPEPAIAAEAVGGLARLGEPLAAVVRGLPSGDEADRRARLLPDLWRSSGTLATLLAHEGVRSPVAELRWRAAYALARAGRADDETTLRGLAGDEDAAVRALATAALGTVGDGETLAFLLRGGRDGDPAVAAAAVRAAAAIVRGGRAAPDPAWRALLLGLAAAPSRALRATAVAQADAWLRDESVAALLERTLAGDDGWLRRLALASLVRGGSRQAGDALVAAARDPDARLRATAASLAGTFAAARLLAALIDDPAPRVRAAAFASLLRLRPDDADVPSSFAADPDPGVRAAALEALAVHPVLPYEQILAASRPDDRAVPTLAVAAVRALAARAGAEPRERGAIVEALEGMAGAATPFLVRNAAGHALVDLGRDAPPTGPATEERRPGDYAVLAARAETIAGLVFETERGDFRIDLACRSAPLSCHSLVTLASQGFFDGQEVESVEPFRALRLGDPRGDGRGGPGWELRDELHPQRALAWSVALERVAPHGAGSRLRILLEEDPSLEDDATFVGEVVEGRAVVTELGPGDRIVRVRVLEGNVG